MALMVIISALFGLAFLILGGTATLSNFGISLVNLPAFLYDPMITKFSLLVGGIVLLASAVAIRDIHSFSREWGGILIGLIVAALGAFPLLLDYNMLDWLPYKVKFTIPPVVLSGFLFFIGAYLLIKTYKLSRSGALFGR